MKELATVFHKGVKGSPLAVFIHGMGMNMTAWTDPASARILGGKYPISALLRDPRLEMKTSFHDVRARGWSVLSWSQSRPVGPIGIAVRELTELIRLYRRYASHGLFFICHSRGGLIARKYIEEHDVPLRGMITLATPHHGTSLARWADLISPLAAATDHILRGVSRKDADSAFRRMLAFIRSSGIGELLPYSPFLGGLRDSRKEGAHYLSLGGTSPDLFRAVSAFLQKQMSGYLPQRLLPDEMREGAGDGLVTAKSSVLPYGDCHRDFPVNHAEILFDPCIRDYILTFLQTESESGPASDPSCTPNPPVR